MVDTGFEIPTYYRNRQMIPVNGEVCHVEIPKPPVFYLFGFVKSQAEGPLAIVALVVMVIAALWFWR
jgi:hypothetical protein